MAMQLHDRWRMARTRLPDGTREPRIKTTTDAAWIAEHGTTEIDIANASFGELPADWQAENAAAAEVAVEAVLKHTPGKANRDEVVEAASVDIHDAWMERNGAWAPAEQMVPYAELPEDEKEKDRAQAREAIASLRASALANSDY